MLPDNQGFHLATKAGSLELNTAMDIVQVASTISINQIEYYNC